MDETRVLLVFPGSLYGGAWAAGPRLKPELVILHGELRRAGFAVDVLDLEVELGEPGDDEALERFLGDAEGLLAERDMDVAVVSCRSALQYSAAMEIGRILRRLRPDAVLAVEGLHASVRPQDFTGGDTPFDWLISGEAETAVLTVAAAVRDGDREHGSLRLLEGSPLPLDAQHMPDLPAYPYFRPGLPDADVFLSRGCPYNAPACLLRPGGGGWHAYPPPVALDIISSLMDSGVGRIDVLDPAFGYDPVWRTAVLQGLAAMERRDVPVTVAGRPDNLTRRDIDRMYEARLRLRLDVATLSPALLSRSVQATRPAEAVDHALDLLGYANAKGLLTIAGFTFNQPGETLETADETLGRLEDFVAAAPNSSVYLQAQSWAYLPAGEPAQDVEAPRQRYGTCLMFPEWWRESIDAEFAAKAVVASRELACVEPGSEEYWRPRFEELRDRLEDKLTAEARRGQRSHESVGSAAHGVPHGWLIEARWH